MSASIPSNQPRQNSNLDKENSIAVPEMGYFCFETVYNKLTGKIQMPNILGHPNFTNDPFSLFVDTWKTEKNVLRGCVSILTKFESCKSIDDWQAGVHGIEVKVHVTSEDDPTIKIPTTISATFLPEVAAEHGWTKTQTIDALLRKGGFKGQITDRLTMKINVTRYQTDKIVVPYRDYLSHCTQ